MRRRVLTDADSRPPIPEHLLEFRPSDWLDDPAYHAAAVRVARERWARGETSSPAEEQAFTARVARALSRWRGAQCRWAAENGYDEREIYAARRRSVVVDRPEWVRQRNEGGPREPR